MPEAAEPVPDPKTLFTPAQQEQVLRSCLKATIATPAYYYCTQIAYFLAPTAAGQRDTGNTALVNPASNTAPLASAIALDSIKAQVASSIQFEAQRLDKQVGAPVSSDGSTNLVSKPGATQLLSLAVESGALTQTQNGNAISLQGNLDQVTRFIIGAQQSLTYATKGTPILQNITVSSSLATNAPSTSSIPVTGSATSAPIATTTATSPSTATKLSSIGARYQFENKYDPKSAQFEAAYKKAITDATSGIAPATIPAGLLRKFFVGVAPCPASNPSDTLGTVIGNLNNCIDETITSAESSNNVQLADLATVAAAVTKILGANAQAYRQAIATAAGVPFTFEYTYNRPDNQPDTHDFRSILAFNAGSGILNANIAGSIYGSKRPSNASYQQFKDFQVAAEFDRSFSADTPNAPSFSIAAYAQWQPSPSVLTLTSTSVPAGITLPANAQSFIMGTQGWLAVVQGKVTFKVGGAQIPLAVKWSNQTSLLDKSAFGGQFGISYDLSQIKQLIGGGSSTP